MTENLKDNKQTTEQAPKKKLTLTLTKKPAVESSSAPAGEVKNSAITRSSTFVVPQQQQRQYVSRDERRTWSPEEREKKLAFLKTAERAKSGVQLGGRPPVHFAAQKSSSKGSRKQRYDHEDGGGNKFAKNSQQDRRRLNIGMGVVQTLSDDLDIEADTGWRKVRSGKKERGFNYVPSIIKTIDVYDNIEVQTLATAMSISMRDLSKKLRSLGLPTTPNSTLDHESAELVVIECGHKVKQVHVHNVDDDPVEDFEGDSKLRAPIITIVGHVDHGKTSLLDAIRNAEVAAGEAGGITQHIGAYQVKASDGSMITFLDTPGHETFTAMRARGVQLTDIALLVVAADDGIKDQTVEAIKHIQNAGVQFIVVITKCDKPEANPDKVLEMLMSYDIVTEKHGGDVIAVEVAAIKGKGIKELLDAIALQAGMMDLKAREEGHAIGVVIETKMQKGFGHVANIIVQKGSLKIGDNFIMGKTYGKVRCLIDTTNAHVKNVGPSTPISVIGLDDACIPGDRMVVVPDEQMAKSTAQARGDKAQQASVAHKSLEELYAHMSESKVLNVILKADTAGSVEALKQGVEGVKNDEVSVKIIDASAGPVAESDILLAEVSKSIVISFHNKITGPVMKFATEKFVHVISEKVIYRILEDLQKLIDGMMTPVYEEEMFGKAKIIRVFEFSRGVVAGCQVLDGKILRGMRLKVLRDGEVVGEGQIRSLQRETQDVKEAIKGQECGLMLSEDCKYQEGDEVVCYDLKQK